MADLSTTYLGLQLKNPIIAASSGLTESLKSIKELENNGAGAVVLKSIFEEDITHEYEALTREAKQLGYNAEHFDYLDYQIRERNMTYYTQLIKECKQAINIPVIASINCFSSYEWEYFALNCEKAGADALELNVFILPFDPETKSKNIEKTYFDIAETITRKVSIPVSLKISPYFSNLAGSIQKLSKTGIKGLVLFNRFFSPDIDIENLNLTSSFVFSKAEEIALPLRWISMMSKRVNCDLSASTGIHDGEGVIKQILAGATTVQLASVLYNEGTTVIRKILKTLEEWMDKKGFDKLDDFRGLMSQATSTNPSIYERVQFMKYFSDKF